ncbi:MAG: hypothetical protein ACYDDA_04730 [Acidiferrobacteraceae bacterium]
MTSLEKALTWGAAGVTAILVALGIYEETKSKPAANSNTVTTTLTPGHRYSFQASCPTAFPALPPAGSTAAVAALLGLTGVSVLTYLPSADGKSFTVTFDYTGLGMTLPPIQSGGGTACTSQLVDLGVSPSTGGTQHGGFNLGQATNQNPGPPPPAQTVTLSGQVSYSAHALAGGQLTVVAPWTILGVASTTAILQGSANTSGNKATMTLSGQPGTIDVRGPNQMGAVITVS